MSDVPLHIVQIAPRIAPGSGVAGVADQLERAFERAGAQVERFTEVEAGRRFDPARRSRLQHAWDVVWFSTRGTAKARRFLAERADAVSICHNDAMVGDVYVNHGLLQVAMRARGSYAWRMVRNPVHVFTALRDRIRYRRRIHRAIVALTSAEAAALRETFGRVAAPVTVIPNGVDLDRFRVPADDERAASRSAIGVDATHQVAVFIGHEFERKGLPIAIGALAEARSTILVVVGGTPSMIARARRLAVATGVQERVRFVGKQADPVPYLWAADVLVLPSAYEANALVVLEAMACGVPVVSTRVGAAADLIDDGENGCLVTRDREAVAQALQRVGIPTSDRRAAARATAERYGWDAVAGRYLELLKGLHDSSGVHDGGALRVVHAIRSDGFSGVERFVARLAVAQRAAGARVTVIGGDPPRMLEDLGDAGVGFRPARTTREVHRALVTLARDHDIDIVNTHMTAADLAAAWAFGARRERPAVVATRHFARPRRSVGPLRLDAVTHRVIDAELSISTAVADAIGVESTVVPTGLADLPGPPGQEREKVVLVAQRLQPEKATDVALDAFAASGLADEGWRLRIAGGGPERDALEASARDHGIAASVELLGPRRDVAELMATASILVAPCPNEGLGLTVLEAMRAGLPVVAADAGGHRDLLGGLDADALFPSGDVAGAATALRRLAHDDEQRARLADAALQRQRTRFSLDGQVQGTDAVYRAAMRFRGAKGGRR